MNQYTIRNVNDIFAIPEDLMGDFIIDLLKQYKNWHEREEKSTRDVNMLFIPDGRHDNISGV